MIISRDFTARFLFSMLGLALSLALLTSTRPAAAQSLPPGVVEIAPGDIQWKPRGPLPGLEQAELIGAQDKGGPYVVRHKFPTGFKVRAHTHPDTKMYTILSGVWCIGYGETFDESKLKCLPAGSFYTEPANTPHFVEVREAVVIQVMGNGPSGTTFIDKDAKH